MSLSLVIDGAPYEVELEETQDGTYQVRVDGEPFEVTVEHQDGHVESHAAGRAYTIQREGRSLIVDGDRVDVGVRHLAQARMGAGETAGGKITPPMPGQIVDVLVEEGDTVDAGDPLVVLEAMKMQNEITAPGDSTVEDVLVSVGDAVEADDVLLVLEPT